MIVAFCGHSIYQEGKEHKRQVLDFLEKKNAGEPVEFYLGLYGAFDRFAYSCAKAYKVCHPSSSLVLVTPYLSPVYLEKRTELIEYDRILYPALEGVPPRAAIVRCNRYVMEQADIVLAYVLYHRGGAYASLMHARKCGKCIFNLGDGMIIEKKKL